MPDLAFDMFLVCSTAIGGGVGGSLIGIAADLARKGQHPRARMLMTLAIILGILTASIGVVGVVSRGSGWVALLVGALVTSLALRFRP